MSEELRLQGISMSEAKRIQQAEAQGSAYEFQARERREVAGLDRAQAQVENAQAAVSQHQAARDGAIGSAIGGLGAVASSVGGLVEENIAKKAASSAVNNAAGAVIGGPMGGFVNYATKTAKKITS
jgi:hypothetical protein